MIELFTCYGIWLDPKEVMPEPGDLIVKWWRHSDSTWSGIYSGSPKDGSFDMWMRLPKPLDIIPRPR